MANYSYVDHVGNGSITTFSFTFAGFGKGYFAQENVHVFLDGVETGFSLSGTNQVTLNPAPGIGVQVRIRRIMPKNLPYSTFNRGNMFDDSLLNNSFLQMLYVYHEFLDGFLDEFPYKLQGTLDMNGNRIVGLPEPLGATEPFRLGDIHIFEQYLDVYVQQAQAAANAAAAALNDVLEMRGTKVQIITAPNLSGNVATLTEFQYEVDKNQVQVYMNGSLLQVDTDYEETSPSTITILAPFTAADDFLFLTGNAPLNALGVDTGAKYGVQYGRGMTQAVREANTIALQNAIDSEKLVQLTGHVEVMSIKHRNGVEIAGITPNITGIYGYSTTQATLRDSTPDNPQGYGNNLWNAKVRDLYIWSESQDAAALTPYRCSFLRNQFSAPSGCCFKYLGHGYCVENKFDHNYFYDFVEGVTSPSGLFLHPTDQFFTDNYFYSEQVAAWHVSMDNCSGSVFTGNHYFGQAYVQWVKLAGFLITSQGNYYEIGNNDVPLLYLVAGNPGSIIVNGDKFWGSGSPTYGVIRVSMNKYNPSKVVIDGCLFESGDKGYPLVTVNGETQDGSSSNQVKWGDNLINGNYSKEMPYQMTGMNRFDSFSYISTGDDMYAGGKYQEYIYASNGANPAVCYIQPNYWPLVGREVFVVNISNRTLTFGIGGTSDYLLKGATSLAPGERAVLRNYASGLSVREIHITK